MLRASETQLAKLEYPAIALAVQEQRTHFEELTASARQHLVAGAPAHAMDSLEWAMEMVLSRALDSAGEFVSADPSCRQRLLRILTMIGPPSVQIMHQKTRAFWLMSSLSFPANLRNSKVFQSEIQTVTNQTTAPEGAKHVLTAEGGLGRGGQQGHVSHVGHDQPRPRSAPTVFLRRKARRLLSRRRSQLPQRPTGCLSPPMPA